MIIIIASMFGPIVEAHSVIIVKMEGLEEVRALEYMKTRLGQGSLGWEEWLGGAESEHLKNSRQMKLHTGPTCSTWTEDVISSHTITIS